MKPEAQVEIKLFDWLLTKSEFIKREIYFNRKNVIGWKSFRVEGERKIPDFLICVDRGYEKEYYTIEIKDNSSSNNILKGSKIIEYSKRYSEGKTKYFIKDKEIQIDGFLLATQSSPKGYLFKKEKIKDNFESKDEDKVKITKEFKMIPRKEGEKSGIFVRQLWTEYGKISDKLNKKCSLGILIANTEYDYKPCVQIIEFKKNKEWTQRWWLI